jgi:hypothetical protein
MGCLRHHGDAEAEWHPGFGAGAVQGGIEKSQFWRGHKFKND